MTYAQLLHDDTVDIDDGLFVRYASSAMRCIDVNMWWAKTQINDDKIRIMLNISDMPNQSSIFHSFS